MAPAQPLPKQQQSIAAGAPALVEGEPIVRLVELQTIPMRNGILGVAASAAA